MNSGSQPPDEAAYLASQVERLYTLLRKDMSRDPSERLTLGELEELRFWRERVSDAEWQQLQLAAKAQSGEPPAPAPMQGASEPRRSEDPAWRSPQPPRPAQPAASAAAGAAAGLSDDVAKALAEAAREHQRLVEELQREHARHVERLESAHSRELEQAQRDEDALRDELERVRQVSRDELAAARGRVAHAQLLLTQRERELAESRAEADALRRRCEELTAARASIERELLEGRASAASAADAQARLAAAAMAASVSAPPALPPTSVALPPASSGGEPARLATLRAEIDALIGQQGGQVQLAESQVGSLLQAKARAVSQAAHSAAGAGGSGAAAVALGLVDGPSGEPESLRPSHHRVTSGYDPLGRARGIGTAALVQQSDSARSRALASGVLALRARTRRTREAAQQMAVAVVGELRETEAEWNSFVSLFGRLWEACVSGTAALAADADAARGLIRSADERSARLDQALRERARVPTRVLCVPTLPAAGEALRSALELRAQSIELAEGPERRTFHFDRVAPLQHGAASLPPLAPELTQMLEAVLSGGSATVVVDGPSGCGKSWLLDGLARTDGADGLLGGAVSALLARAAQLEAAATPQLCALWLSAVDVLGEQVTDVLARGGGGRREEGALPPSVPLRPLSSAVPSYEAFLHLARHLRAHGGAELSARQPEAAQWVRARAARARAPTERVRGETVETAKRERGGRRGAGGAGRPARRALTRAHRCARAACAARPVQRKAEARAPHHLVASRAHALDRSARLIDAHLCRAGERRARGGDGGGAGVDGDGAGDGGGQGRGRDARRAARARRRVRARAPALALRAGAAIAVEWPRAHAPARGRARVRVCVCARLRRARAPASPRRQQHVPYRHSRLTHQLQAVLSASGLVLHLLPVQCAALAVGDDSARSLAVASQVKALELSAARHGARGLRQYGLGAGGGAASSAASAAGMRSFGLPLSAAASPLRPRSGASTPSAAGGAGVGISPASFVWR